MLFRKEKAVLFVLLQKRQEFLLGESYLVFVWIPIPLLMLIRQVSLIFVSFCP
jgi:hypothetical protein